MNTSNTFRSHLMQQFVNHARNQSRTPPIALSSWLRMNDNNDPNDENEMNDLQNESSTTTSKNNNTTTTIPSEAKTQMTHSNRVLSNRLSSSSQQQQQLQRFLSTYSYSSNNKNNDDDNNHNNNPNIIDTLSSVLLSSPVMDPHDETLNSIPANLPPSLASQSLQQQSLSPFDRTSSSSRQQPQQSVFHLPNTDHDTPPSSIRTMTPTELSLAFQTIISTRHATNHFRKAITTSTTTGTTNTTTNTTENETNHPMEHMTSTVLPPPPPPVVWYTKYDYEMAIIRAVRVGFTAPNHKRTEPYIFQRILSDTTIERLADIAAKVYYYQQMNKLLLLLQKPSIIMNDNYGDDTRSLESPYEQQRQQIINSMEKKREKWRNIPAYLVTLLVPKTKTTKTEVTLSDSSLVGITMTDHNSSSNMKSNQNFGINNEQTDTTTTTAITNMETTTMTKNENDTTNPSTNPDAYWYRPRPFRPIVSEQDCEDYASACAATQNVLLSLHSEQMATKWVTGPIIHTPAFHQLLQLPLDGTDDVSSSSSSSSSSSQQPQHRVVALIMIGQAVDNENDETTNTTTTTNSTTTSQPAPSAAMDYFHRLHHQQQRRIPKRRTFQDLLQDL